MTYMAERRRGRKRPLPGYKACRSCSMVVREDEARCPNCGSSDFTDDWSGLIIVIRPEESCIAKRLNITKPGMYAIEVL